MYNTLSFKSAICINKVLAVTDFPFPVSPVSAQCGLFVFFPSTPSLFANSMFIKIRFFELEIIDFLSAFSSKVVSTRPR